MAKATWRSDETWVDALEGRLADGPTVVQELASFLERILRRVTRGRMAAEDVADLVQESMARIVQNLGRFRGDSAFTTWAGGVATRVAFTELRRRSVRAGLHESFEALAPTATCPVTPPPDEAASKAQLVHALRSAIATELTERQRAAVLAELRGIPTIEIAERLGIQQNALYKLTHDARKKLRKALLAGGFTEESIHTATAEEAG